MNNVIIYLTGKPGVGKYTISKILAKNYGFIICDNQLINNPVFALLQYDGIKHIPNFAWDAVEGIRKIILEFLTKIPNKSFVLTNCLSENEGDRLLYEQVKNMSEIRGSKFIPVRLLLSKEEHLNRLTQVSRLERWKSIDPKDAEDNGPQLIISHPNFLELDITHLYPENAARYIIDHANKVM